MHELNRKLAGPKRMEERGFGLAFSLIFLMAGVLPLIAGHPARWWSLLVAVLFFSVALIAPHVLAPLNTLFMKVASIVSHIVNFAIMAVLFYFLFTPYGVVMRLFGKRLLQIGYDRGATYWVKRQSSAITPESMSNQF